MTWEIWDNNNGNIGWLHGNLYEDYMRYLGGWHGRYGRNIWEIWESDIGYIKGWLGDMGRLHGRYETMPLE